MGLSFLFLFFRLFPILEGDLSIYNLLSMINIYLSKLHKLNIMFARSLKKIVLKSYSQFYYFIM